MSNPRSFNADRASDLFPALAYAPDDGLFLFDDQSFGFGFACEPLAFLDPAQSERLSVLLNLEWPKDTLMQIMLWASPDVERGLTGMMSLCTEQSDPLLRRSNEARLQFLRGATTAGLGARINARVRDLQLLITVKLALHAPVPTVQENETAVELRASAEQVLRTLALAPRRLDADAYVRLMNTLLNWDMDAAWRQRRPQDSEFDRTTLLNEQFLDYSHSLDIDADGIDIGDYRAQTFSIKRFPDRLQFGVASRFLVEITTGTRGIAENALICLNLHFPDAEATQMRLAAGRHWASHQAGGALVSYLPALRQRKRHFDALFEQLDNGERPLRAYLGVVLFTPKADALSAASNLRTYWRELGFQILPDRYFVLPLFLNCLPFGGDRKAIRDMRRYRTLSASHAVTLAPVFGDWKGSGSPVVALIGRTGQLVQFSLFDSASNYNAVIAAPSGTGKSFLANELLVTTLSVGGRCWVIDVGRSYEKTCAALGGKFAAFTRETSPSFNPFCMIEDWDEEADVIAGITAAMIAPTQTLSDFHSAALQETLKRVWDEHGREMTLDAVAAALRASTDQRIRDMGQQLFVFTTQGEYGRYFSGRAAIELDNSFVVLELEELKQRKHLQRVILLQLIYRIQQEMFHGDRAQQKIVLIDEAWDLLAESDAAKFIEVGYRRFRKYGGAAIIATQSLNDLYTNPVGRAIAENSAHTLLLAQPGNAIDQLLAENRLPIGASGARMLKSVHTVPGAYSEIMVLSDRGGGVGRLIVDPFTRLLYTTEPGEVAALQGLRSRGLSYERAIQVLLGAQTHA